VTTRGSNSSRVNALPRRRVTLGPKGQTSSQTRIRAPLITKAGVTVAKGYRPQVPIENMGAQMVRRVARRPPTWPATAPRRHGGWPSDLNREGTRTSRWVQIPWRSSSASEKAVAAVSEELKKLQQARQGR